MNRDVRLLVEGALLERLLERSLSEGAVFARVRRRSVRKICVDTDSRSAELLLSLCKRYGLNCRILHRRGRSAYWEHMRKRWTIFPGLALCILLCGLFLTRLWMIDVCFTASADDANVRQRIYACLAENGIHPGISTAKIDSSMLQAQLRAAVDELSYVGVRQQGIQLLVEASIETPAPQLYALDNERDLLAAQNGVIDSIVVYSGQACVQPGDTVLRGDVLIRGIERKSKEETAPVGALGEVIARCWYEGCASAPLYQSEYARTGRETSESRLCLGHFSLTLAEPAHYTHEECETDIFPIVGLFLPLQLERITRYETTLLQRSQDQAELQAALTTLACADALRQIPTAHANDDQSASCWTNAEIEDGILRIRAVYEIYTDIAVTRDALIEEVY